MTHSSSHGTGAHRLSAIGLLVTIGIVFGDIGTSPLYVMKAITGVSHNLAPDRYIIGAVSCIIWTLTIQTTLKYVLIALRADNKGEGGILALYALLRRLPHKWLYVAAAVGASTLIADGVITPAVTVTSAIEGLQSIDPDVAVIPIVILIITLIFAIQPLGTAVIGKCFGPFMLIWFTTLAVAGIPHIIQYTPILKAFNPWYAIDLLITEPGWMFIVGAVFLCTTGAEALFSDLGHCGRLNISVSWIYVKVALILNYLGQGAWLISHNIPTGINPFYGIMPEWALIPSIILATGAAIIASQALISGSFTIYSEAMNLDFWPRLRIKYPARQKGQLYIPSVNIFLYLGCLLTVLYFRSSGNMEAAYGLAITITMLVTTLLLVFYLHSKGVRKLWIALFAGVFGAVEGCFLVANLFKFWHGGWFTLLIATGVCFVMLVWCKGIRIRSNLRELLDIDGQMGLIDDIRNDKTIPLTANNLVFVTNGPNSDKIDSKLMYSIKNKGPKRADHYFLLRIDFTDQPDTLEYDVVERIPGVFFDITLHIGFQVRPRVNAYVRQIVGDLVANHRMTLDSNYPSLRRHGVPGNFRFIILKRKFSPSSACTPAERFILTLHQRLRRLGQTDINAYGLDTSTVTVETVPLILRTRSTGRIVPSQTDV